VARSLGGFFRIVHFTLFVYLPILSVCRHSLRSLVIGRSIDRCLHLYLITVGPGSPSWAPPGSSSNKWSFFLAATAIELASLLGYGRSQYTGNCTNVINTTFGGAAGDYPRLHRASRHGVSENFLAASWHCDGGDTVA